jgi:thymidylate kinase
MNTMPTLHPPFTPTGADELPSGGAGRILEAVLETFERAGLRTCILHGYQGFPQRIGSDVDCLVEAGVTQRRLLRLLHDNRLQIGAEVVRCSGLYVVLAGAETDGSPVFLTLDMSVDYEVEGAKFFSGAEFLGARRRFNGYWVPAAHHEFAGYLLRSISKGRLDEERTTRLSALFQEDPESCHGQAARFWSAPAAALIIAAAQSGDWSSIRDQAGALGSEARRRAFRKHPMYSIGAGLRGFARRIGRLARPDGMDVVLLGPDGAGKSSLIEALETGLTPAFPRSVCWGFAPPLLRSIRRDLPRRVDQPHSLPPRSLPTSLLRAAYWLAYGTLGYLPRHVALARSTLVLNDRHFVDILVDRTRYRYGGPIWLLELIWRLMPKPDLIVLLDAPAEVLQARKQEVPFEVTARQRDLYRALMARVANGHIADAAQPRENVASEVGWEILNRMARRVRRRRGLI